MEKNELLLKLNIYYIENDVGIEIGELLNFIKEKGITDMEIPEIIAMYKDENGMVTQKQEEKKDIQPPKKRNPRIQPRGNNKNTPTILTTNESNVEILKRIILSGYTIDEFCNRYVNIRKDVLYRTLEKFNFMAQNYRKSGQEWIADEHLVELFRYINFSENKGMLNSKINSVRMYLKDGVCKNGKIRNVLINCCDDNKYITYYVLERMKKLGQVRMLDKEELEIYGDDLNKKLDVIIERIEMTKRSKKNSKSNSLPPLR